MEGNDSTHTAENTLNKTDTIGNNKAWQVIDAVTFEIETVYLWIILILGLPGNCATIVTVTKMSPAKSLTVYIALLAVVDNFAIIGKLLMFVLLDNKVHVGDAGCKLLGFFGNFLSTFANWLLVALSMERLAAVWFPVKVAQMWSFKKSTITVTLLSCVLSIMFLHLFWTITFIDDRASGMVYCSAVRQYIYFMQHIWYWINVMIYATLPCVLLLVFNVLIIIGIVRSQKLNTYLKEGRTDTRTTSRNDCHRQVTIMLVTAAITLVVLTTPRCIILILTPYYNPSPQSLEGSVYYFLDTLAFVLCDLNHAVNFYVYSLSARTFRYQFVEVFLCRKLKTKTVNASFSMTVRNTEARTEV